MRIKLFTSLLAGVATLALVGIAAPDPAEAGYRGPRHTYNTCVPPAYRDYASRTAPRVRTCRTAPQRIAAPPARECCTQTQAFVPPLIQCARGYHLGVGPGGRPWCNRNF